VPGHHRPPLQVAEGRPRVRQQPERAHVAHAGAAGLTTLNMMKRILTAGAIAIASAALAAQGPTKTVNSLQMTVKSVERTERASLRDCPPGTNTVSAVQRPGDEIAVVTVNFKVMPDFKPFMLKRPTVTTADDKVYNTS